MKSFHPEDLRSYVFSLLETFTLNIKVDILGQNPLSWCNVCPIEWRVKESSGPDFFPYDKKILATCSMGVGNVFFRVGDGSLTEYQNWLDCHDIVELRYKNPEMFSWFPSMVHYEAQRSVHPRNRHLGSPTEHWVRNLHRRDGLWIGVSVAFALGP